MAQLLESEPTAIHLDTGSKGRSHVTARRSNLKQPPGKGYKCLKGSLRKLRLPSCVWAWHVLESLGKVGGGKEWFLWAQWEP